MISAISLIFISALFFSSNIKSLEEYASKDELSHSIPHETVSDIKTFDEDLLNKTAIYLKLKNRQRNLREQLYPAEYFPIKVISEQQYLEDKKGKYLVKDKESCERAKNYCKWIVGGAMTSFSGLYLSWKYNFELGKMLFITPAFACGIVAAVSGLVLYLMPPAVTEQQKKEFILLILDNKIQNQKTIIKNYEKSIEAKNKKK